MKIRLRISVPVFQDQKYSVRFTTTSPEPSADFLQRENLTVMMKLIKDEPIKFSVAFCTLCCALGMYLAYLTK